MPNNRTECLIYSRVTGWLSPVKNWNKGKASEFKDRKCYDIDKAKKYEK